MVSDCKSNMIACVTMLRLGVLVLAISHAPAAQPAEDQIHQVLQDQTAARNRGDIPAFMTGYEDSGATSFLGKELRRGYQAVLARYLRDYPDQEAMGETAFSELEVRMLGEDHALVLGRFDLARAESEGGALNGRFTLVFRKTRDGWKIIHDHTSA